MLRLKKATIKMLSKFSDSSSNELMLNHDGPLFDSGATYSAIGIVEVAAVAEIILPN